MMQWANVTEDDLQKHKEISTSFGETLSWDYLCYGHKVVLDMYLLPALAAGLVRCIYIDRLDKLSERCV